MLLSTRNISIQLVADEIGAQMKRCLPKMFTLLTRSTRFASFPLC